MIYLILVFGLMLRLVSLNQSVWLDEATTALVSKLSIGEIFTKFLPGDFHPPLYYVVMKFWTDIFGRSEIALRAPSIIFALGTIYITYLIGRKLFDKEVGLLASILLATSGLSIYYSQEARMYCLAAFLVALAFHLFLEKKWSLFAITLALIGMTDYVSLFIIPVFFVVGWKYRKNIIISLIPLLVIFVFWSPIFVKQILGGLSVEGSNWWGLLGTPTVKNLALVPVKFIFGRISFDNKIMYGILATVMSGIYLYIIILNILRLSLKERPCKVLWAWLILPIVIGVIVSFKIPTLTYFRYIFCLPAFYLLLASGISKLKKFPNIVMIFLIMFNLTTSGYYLFSPRFQREDWRGLVNFVENFKKPDSITIFPTNSNKEAYLYYAPDVKIAGLDGAREGYSQIWFVDYISNIFGSTSTTKSKVEALGYKQIGDYGFNRIGTVYLYAK